MELEQLYNECSFVMSYFTNIDGINTSIACDFLLIVRKM